MEGTASQSALAVTGRDRVIARSVLQRQPAQSGAKGSNLPQPGETASQNKPAGTGSQKYIKIRVVNEKTYSVYIMTNNHNTTLYTGVTNNLFRRVQKHKAGEGSKFTRRYNITKLVYYETTNDIESAIWREKQIKGGSRKKKIDLINSINPDWRDLTKDLYS